MPAEKFVSILDGQITELTSDEAYRKFFELSTDLFLALDRDGRIATVNASWESVLGFTPEEMIGQEYLTFVHPSDLEVSTDAFKRAVASVKIAGLENRYRRKDGTYRVLCWKAQASGDTVYAVARDVTEDYEAKQKLEEANRRMHNALQLEREARAMTETQQERFRDLFAQAPMIAVVFSGPDQVIELANPSFYTLVNYRNLMGRPVREAIHLDEETSRTLSRVYKTGERFVGKNFSIRADWSESGKSIEKLFHCIFEPIRGATGKVDVIWCLLFDVTETVEMEAKLRSAERMASLGEMAAGVAHEINNPLGYTLISLEMLQNLLASRSETGVIAPEIDAILGRATEGVERVQNIVKGLKSFTRNDESRVEPVDLAAPLRAAVNFTTNETRHRAIVTTDFGYAPMTLANEGRLTQVFINLIVNAAQAIEPGRANDHRIDIKLFTDETGRAIVEIRDTGCGIPAEQLEHIYEPFFTTKPVGVGTGLGLSICHGIITGLGGDIAVSSIVGSGTNVRISMPAAKSVEPLPQVVPTKAFVQAEEVKNKRKRKVLVVDDDRSLRDVILSAIEDEHDVVSVDSAIEALATLGDKPVEFDWIVCDVMMPQMTGMEFFERMKSRNDGSEKKIILMTGGAFTPAVRSWMDSLTNAKLEKPFRIRQLKQLLENEN